MNMRANHAILASALLLVFGQTIADEETFLKVSLPGTTDSVSFKDRDIHYWDFDCKVDVIDDQRYCSVFYKFSLVGGIGDFYITVKQGSKVYLWAVGGNAYPGSEQIIRVDANKPHRTNERGPFVGTPDLLSEIRSGEVLRTRWYDWPYNNKQDKEHSLKGFGDALDMAIAIVDGKEFSLPLASLENIYYWRGVALRRAHENIRAAMDKNSRVYKYTSKDCNLTFDADQRVNDILELVPGVAGVAFRQGYAEPLVNIITGTQCGNDVTNLSRMIEPIPNLIHPE